MNDRIVEEIVASAGDRYGSLEEPGFSFVREAMAADPYAPLVHRLGEEFDCGEETEPNDDVSFGYLLTNRRGAWVLRLSMIGPYAVLMRLQDDGGTEVVVAEGDEVTEDERRLLRLLEAEGITAIDRETLTRPFPLTLPNTTPGDVRIYQALFTDTDVLPWEGGAVVVR